LIDFLASIPALHASSSSALKLLAGNLETTSLAAGDVLLRQGDRADCLYVVVSGELLVEVTLPDGSRHRVATLGCGDCVGEIALLLGTPRSATVIATSDAQLLKITSSALERFFAAEPAARERFLEASSRRLLSLHLASSPLFAGLDPATLREFDREANWLRLPGGETLFEQGDPPDALYVLVRGRLDVVVEREGGVRDVVEQIGRGACVGELGLLTGEPRSATVRAGRDSELLRLSKEDFDAFLARHQRGAAEIARTLARRLQHTTAKTGASQRISTIALLPAGGTTVSPRFAEQFVEALSALGGGTLRLSSRRPDLAAAGFPTQGADDGFHARLLNWLGEQEERFRHIVLECDASASDWTKLCLRQADLVFIVSSPDADPMPGGAEAWMLDGNGGRASARTELVVVHESGSIRPTGTMRWLRRRRVSAHHHVRLDARQDHDRLARFATGRAVGVVFGGGGARGYLHLGVVKALRESGVPIDTVGGTSIGAIVAALCALDYDVEQMIEMGTTGFAAHLGSHLLRDTTFPVVAFLSARRVVKMIKTVFGDTRIEDLWLPFFCVSANLSTAELMVHDRGPLWLALRATGSAPGILPPVLYHGELLVDGGLLRNVPVDTMRNRQARTVIASDIALPVDLTVAPRLRVALSGWSLLWDAIRRRSAPKQSVPHILNILFRTATLNTIHNTDVLRRQADLYLHPVAVGINTLDWKAGRQLVAQGYEYALTEIEAWKHAGGFRACHPS
jgi:CRP-like cAMP-binding protein/predicted acylesterase/phospholipase RssA